MALVLRQRSVLPGFGPALGFTLLYLGLVVLLPLSAAFLKTFTLTWAQFIGQVTSGQVDTNGGDITLSNVIGGGGLTIAPTATLSSATVLGQS